MKIATSSNNEPRRGCIPTTAEEWNILSNVLNTYIQHCIHTLNIFYWQGGEYLLAEDVLTETYLRAIPYARNAEHGTLPPIGSFEALCKTIAKRYLLDLRRKDKRLVASIDIHTLSSSHLDILMSVDPAEAVLEDMTLYSTMLTIVKEIKKLSPKQKEAILIHIANLADFDNEQPRPLERAFWTVGIPLREYRRELPSSPVMRSRHTASLCLAIKALRQTFSRPPSQPDHAA